MVNLANVQARGLSQDRITNNRDAILPTRREDRAPGIDVVASVRDAYRGNAQVEETRRLLGLVNSTAQQIGQLGVNQDILAAPKDRAAAALDAAAGNTPNPAYAKSQVYQATYYGAKSEAFLTKWKADTDQQIQDAIDQGKTPADVHELLQNQVKQVTASAPQDFPTPQAQHELGVGLLQYASALEAKVTAQFKEKADQELVSNEGFNLTSRLTSGEGPAVTVAPLPDTASPTGKDPSLAPAKFTMPVAGRITSKFGDARETGSHNGLDIAAPKGSPVGAAAPGKVVDIGTDPRSGTFVKVQHADGSTTSYAHLGSVRVIRGMEVDTGSELGTVGTTGHTTGPHVHFVYRDPNGDVRDPQSILGKSPGGEAQAGVSLPVPTVAKRATLQQDVNDKFEASMETLRQAGISPKAAKAGLLDSIIRWGTNPDDPHPEELLAFANATQRDGKTPSMTPGEREKVQNAAVTAIGYAQRLKNKARQDAQDVLEPHLYEALAKGEDATPTIDQAVKNGVFTPDEGLSWRTRFRTEIDRTEKGEVNYAVANGYQLELTEAGADVSDIRRRATESYNNGEFGTGKAAAAAFTSVMKMASQRRASKPSNAPEAMVWRGEVTDVLRPDNLDLRGNKAVSFAYRSALAAWEQKVDAGMEPQKAAQETIDEWGPKIDQAVKMPFKAASAPGKPGARPPPPQDNETARQRIQQLAAARQAKLRELTTK